MTKTKEVKFEIVEHIATIEEFGSGWTFEFNLVKWADGEPKLDLRNWNEDHSKCSRGMTLFESEMDKVVKAYKEFKK